MLLAAPIQAESLHLPAAAGHVIRDASASGGRAIVLTGRGGATARVRVGAQVEVQARVRAVPCAGGARVVVSVGETRALSARVTSRRWTTVRATASVLAGRRTLTVRTAGTRCRRALRVDRITVSSRAGARTIWVPSPTTTWQWQLTGTIDTSVPAQMYDVDLYETPQRVVDALHARGRRVVCYLSAGSFEAGRPDADRFAPEVLGDPLDGYPDERWLDVRRLDVLGPLLEARMDLCAAKGFDGVEADNVDGYANRSGFALTADDQLRFNRFLAAAAHARGLSIGLKNDLDQVAALEPAFDWALNEQCFQYDECDRLQPFVAAGKAVFVAEYEGEPAAFCARARTLGLRAMLKRLELGPYRRPCW
jgi:hypothetical protein